MDSIPGMFPDGTIALVTGGGRGIGRCIAHCLAHRGASVCILGPLADELLAVESELKAIGPPTMSTVADLTDETQVQSAFHQVREQFGPIDVLVNNAGIAGPAARADQVRIDDWNEVLSVNLTGAFLCAREVIPDMIERRSGRIINISSIAGKIAYPFRAPYAVSKWGLIGLTLTLAKELAPHHVTVNAVCPGPVAGERMREVIACRAAELNQTEEYVLAEYLKTSAMGKMSDEADVAAMVVFLAGESAANITGQSIDVAAGFAL